MRRVTLLAVAVALVLGACSSSSDPLTFDLAQPMEPPPTRFTVSGSAVDEGAMCESGVFVDYRMEDADGNPIEIEGWAAIFETAVETGSVAQVTSYNDYECADGSGTITVRQQVRFDFATLDVETFGQGRIDAGTWTLEGSGDYESLSGSGDLVNDNDQGRIHMVGEVET